MLSAVLLSTLLLLRLKATGGFAPILADSRGVRTSPKASFLAPARSHTEVTPTSAEDSDIITILSDDLQTELQSQNPNEDSSVYDYTEHGHVQPLRPLDDRTIHPIIRHAHFETHSLDDLFPALDFSKMFNSNSSFRKELREAIRQDMVFDDQSRPSIYGYMTDEERHHELAKQSSLIGYWKLDEENDRDEGTFTDSRMKQTSAVLWQYLGSKAPTGDEFMETIGSLTNSTDAPFHWTEVSGVAATQNKKMGDKTEHAWHQDYGQLEKQQQQDDSSSVYRNNHHVFFGFPYENHYNGTGVFPHMIKLKHEQWGVSNKPVFYKGTVPEPYIVRPRYVSGREIIVFRDVDVLHSTPDIQYRTSIMRFG